MTSVIESEFWVWVKTKTDMEPLIALMERFPHHGSFPEHLGNSTLTRNAFEPIAPRKPLSTHSGTWILKK